MPARRLAPTAAGRFAAAALTGPFAFLLSGLIDVGYVLALALRHGARITIKRRWAPGKG
jgi:hypothetical protein